MPNSIAFNLIDPSPIIITVACGQTASTLFLSVKKMVI